MVPCGYLCYCLVALLPISPGHSSCSLPHFLFLSVSWSSECIDSCNETERSAAFITHLRPRKNYKKPPISQGLPTFPDLVVEPELDSD